MNVTSALFEELAIKPILKVIVPIAFLVCTVAGISFEIIDRDIAGLITSSISLLVFLIATIVVMVRKKDYEIVLIIALYAGIAVFSEDIFSNLLSSDPHAPVIIPIDIIVIFLISFPLSLLLPRLMIFPNCLYSAVLFLVFTLVEGSGSYLIYNISVQPVFIMATFTIWMLRDAVTKLLVKLYGESLTRNTLDLNAHKITKAEYTCLCLLADGKMTKEIATIEKCSENAIQQRLGSVYAKLGVADRQSLMYLIGRSKLVWKD